MQLGVSSYAFGWAVGVNGQTAGPPFTELDLVNFARAHGLGIIQFGDHIPLPDFDDVRLNRLFESTRNSSGNIEIETGGRGLTHSNLSRYIAVSEKLHTRLLRFVIDGPDYEPDIKEVAALIRATVPALEKAGLTLGIENHDRFSATTLRQLMEVVDCPRVGICLDTVNSLGAGEGLEHVLHELGPHTVNLHLKDFSISRVPHAMGFVVEGRPAGQGMLNVPSLLAKLTPHGRCRTAVLETWTTREAAMHDTLAKERRWAEESLTYLKPLFASP